jgi:flagellar hook-associated protein 2
MAALSSPGIGSGLDIKTIVPQLVALERQPIDRLNARNTDLQTKLSAFGLLSSYTDNIHDAIAKLGKPTFWQQTSSTSSDSSAVVVSSSSEASVGSYSVEVSQLAQSQSLASKAYTDSAASVGTGTLHIEFGSWSADGTVFTAATPPSQVDIPVPLGENSLDALKAKINAANAGLAASIVKDASGTRLVIRSTVTGVEHSVRITATADAPAAPGGPTLNDLTWPQSTVPPTMTETAKAQNAKATISGLAIESSSNTFSDVSDGLSITVAKTTTGPVTLKVGLDTASMKSAINDFVAAYSAFNKYIADQTKYDPDKKVAATLQGDRSTLSLQSQLRSMLQASNRGASSTYAQLSDVGIETQPDGSLKVNDSKLSAAMNSNMPELVKAFTAEDTLRPANSGFAVRLEALTQTLNNSDGVIATRSQGLRSSIARNSKQVNVLEDRVAAFQERLLKQYSALDTTINSLNSLNAYVTQQITNWNKSK